MAEFVSRKVAAEALGISRQRVEQLIKRGDFKETSSGVDLVAARRTHARLKRLDKAAGTKAVAAPKSAGKRSVGAAKSRPVKTAPAPAPAAAPAPAVVPEDGNLFDFAEARAKKENWNAALAEATFKKLIGALISRNEVAAKEFAVARKLRDRIIGFPARLATFMPPEAMRLLTEECNQLVRELQEDAATVAESGAAA